MKKTKFFHDQQRDWVVIDAKDKVLGRLATQVAKILQGKNKATYTPNAVVGDKVIIVNAKHIRLTGNKLQGKVYDKYTGYPSGRKEMPFNILAQKNPNRVVRMAIKGMLPRNSLARTMLKSLRIYPERQHDQVSQKPKSIDIGS